MYLKGKIKIKWQCLGGNFMKTWTEEIEINAPIETVWKVIDGSEENLKKLDPKIISSKVIEETEKRIGSRYLQEYKEGRKVMEYVVEVKDYLEDDNNKMFEIGFELGNWFDITVKYVLKKVDENKTHLVYSTTNRPMKFFAKIMMRMMGNDSSVVKTHVEKIKKLSET